MEGLAAALGGRGRRLGGAGLVLGHRRIHRPLLGAS
jgi:hypothetical protein